jgi:phosphoglycerate dehydrogenase-like enzyme
MTGKLVVAIDASPDRLEFLRTIAPDWEFVQAPTLQPKDALRDDLLDATVLVTDFPPSNVAAMSNLQWIQLGSAGYAQLAGSGLAQGGIRVTNASGVNDVPIAEWCVLMMLMFERDVPGLMRAQRERAWDRPSKFQSELRGRRVGIVGYGSIGRQVARACRGLGLEVGAMNRTPVGPTPLRYAPDGTGDTEGVLPHRTFALGDWDGFLPQVDYLVMTATLNAGTTGLIGADQLRLLPSHAVILNPARAPLVDEAALTRALREGWIAGAAIDSHYREPVQPDDPAWDLPNAILTPHISGSTHSPYRDDRLWDLVGCNLERFLTGEPLLNEIPSADLPV